jgi:hypothetical protein
MCRGYVSSVQDAPNDMRIIIIEVGSVKCVVELLQDLNAHNSTGHGDGFIILQKLEGPDGPIEGCLQTLKELSSLLPEPAEAPPDGKRRKKSLSLASLMWPFKEGKARKLLERLGRHKATISLALTAETVYVYYVPSVSHECYH